VSAHTVGTRHYVKFKALMTLRELSREGIITTGGGGITVLDPDALTKAAGYEMAWA